ncbi:hypothetical protein POM88_049833 [Heracleum sosnowskyi]|uniref:Uncharacterized protein n=1 Tax=Heracleum sosnowskyi TaxID=360622 RepID=A0AAD8GYV6_9APIA|nr:hypothetical protein POM88_049833 [Heracleum sosnowskyi]
MGIDVFDPLTIIGRVHSGRLCKTLDQSNFPDLEGLIYYNTTGPKLSQQEQLLRWQKSRRMLVCLEENALLLTGGKLVTLIESKLKGWCYFLRLIELLELLTTLAWKYC